jgi:peptide/nickel transport system substrate-binding protein
MEKFVILTPPADYDPKRAFAGTMVQEWVRELGMPAFARPMAFSSLLDTVKGKHEFDAFILGYGKLNLDPDYMRAFFYSKIDKPRGWNMSGYSNPEFDEIANAQRSLVDTEKRKELIWKMQEMILEDVPYLPLYNPHIIEATFNERFTGWVEKVNGIGNIWSMCVVKPAE